jgi:predicted nucleic acid-binding protein
LSALLLDASTILAAFDSEDEMHEPSKTIMLDPLVTIATLDLARYEVANVAIRAWRSPTSVTALLEAIDRIEGDGGVHASTTTLLSGAAKLAEEHTIPVYDAAYVTAANRAGCSLVSCDIRDLVGKGLAITPADAHARRAPAVKARRKRR